MDTTLFLDQGSARLCCWQLINNTHSVLRPARLGLAEVTSAKMVSGCSVMKGWSFGSSFGCSAQIFTQQPSVTTQGHKTTFDLLLKMIGPVKSSFKNQIIGESDASFHRFRSVMFYEHLHFTALRWFDQWIYCGWFAGYKININSSRWPNTKKLLKHKDSAVLS